MVCADTSFLIDVILGRPIPKEYENLLDERNISITSPSIMELVKGLYLKNNLKYVTNEEKEKINETIFSMNVLEFDRESAILAGEIEAELTNQGNKIELMDVMIAAICIENNEPLVTRNKKHFERIKELKIQVY